MEEDEDRFEGFLLKKHVALYAWAIVLVAISLRPIITSIGPIIDHIQADQGLTHVQVTWLTSVPILCMGLFALLIPRLERYFTTHGLIAFFLFAIGVATAIRLVDASYRTLLVTAFIGGVGIAIVGPVLSAWIKRTFPERFELMIGLYSFGIGIGATLSSSFTAPLMSYFGTYATALGIWSLFAVVGLLFWRFIPKERVIVAEQTKPMRNPWRTKRAWSILLFFGLQVTFFFTTITWIVPLLMEAGHTRHEASFYVGVMTSVQIVTNIAFPAALNKWPTRAPLFIHAMFLGGFLALANVVWGPVSGHLISMVLFGIVLGATFPLALVFPLREARHEKEASAWNAMAQAGGFLMAGTLPLLVGALNDATGTYTTTYISITTCLLGLYIVYLYLNKKTA